SAILAAYSTGPYGNYPNPGIHPGMIGPGTFNASGVANPQWKIPGDLNVNKGLVIGNPANGSMGAGAINVENIYANGSKLITEPEKYCKITNAFYTGNLSGIAGADAKCVAEFGAGWSFVNTNDEFKRVIYPSAMFAMAHDPYMQFRAWASAENIAHIPTPNCKNWTCSDSSEAGHTIYLIYAAASTSYEWTFKIFGCDQSARLWCCPI
ncbi:MAG: hypothetical protein DRP06_03065, partial [Candidatus Aenigmatarchaeota archaeon]